MKEKVKAQNFAPQQDVKAQDIASQLGLSFEFLNNGAVKSIEAGSIRISLSQATPYSLTGTNIYLRKRTKPYIYTALTGLESNSVFSFTKDGFAAKGNWEGIEYLCTLQLSTKSLSWQWKIDIKNTSGNDTELDLIYLQDVGLKTATDGVVNEYYTSQYTERLVLNDKNYGQVICCRQNTKEANGHPWLMIACKNGAESASTDGMQFYGARFRETRIPIGLLEDKLGGEYAGESSVVALQQKPFKISAGDDYSSVFVATYMHNHPEATSNDDLNRLPNLVNEFGNATPDKKDWVKPVKNLFNTSQFLSVKDLSKEELNTFFGEEKRHKEEQNGKLLSFFSKENNHIVLKEKELVADRPHAHIMQAKAGLVPNENIVSANPMAYGVFNSHLTQGNTNFNVLLSVCSSQFNLALETGQRIFVKIEGKHYLLGVPSAYEIGLNHCRWIYKFDNYCFQVRTWTSKTAPQVNLDIKELSGKQVDMLITHDFDKSNSWYIESSNMPNEFVCKPKADSMIAGKFSDAQFRMLVQSTKANFKACGDEVLYPENNNQSGSLFILDVKNTSEFCMSFVGEVCEKTEVVKFENADKQWVSDCNDAQSSWKNLSLNLNLQGDNKDVSAISEILPWYGINALTHYLTPYGLEQFSGAAWGTRDVSQGPIDLLLSLAKYDDAKQVLCTIFSNQNPDGWWPQWWMFDSYTNIRADEAHGDIAYWCIIALCSYIKVTGDTKILDEILPYHNENNTQNIEKTPLGEHVERLINTITGSFINDTALVPFGGGDWNDSLQPVSEDLAKRMISSWTVEMNYQAFSQYQEVYELIGNNKKANELKTICGKIKSDFNKYLVKDGLVAGYGLVEKDGSIGVLLHPTDTTTGINYSILPMNRGIISGIFTKEQAKYHQEQIEKHLKAPDGARLMDKPLKYKGGIQTIFQRAESSTFFGREIGLMYMHEHIRYAESLAIMGRGDDFVEAMRQAIPVSYNDVVPCGDVRQSNCYYSSSDVAFKSRYDAYERYNEIKTGNLTLRGGWRVYSSGPGIYVGLVISRLLGLRIEHGNLIIDPVLPKSFDGFTAKMDFMGHSVTFKYAVKQNNFGVKEITVNGNKIAHKQEDNKYRQGGAVIPTEQLLAMLNKEENAVEVLLYE